MVLCVHRHYDICIVLVTGINSTEVFSIVGARIAAGGLVVVLAFEATCLLFLLLHFHIGMSMHVCMHVCVLIYISGLLYTNCIYKYICRYLVFTQHVGHWLR